MAFSLQNVTAVQNGQASGVLGHLMWYSVGKQLIKRDELGQKLLASGLDESWMPNPIRSSDAFRRATREVQTRKATAQAGVFENFLVREVYSDKEIIQRNIFVETVDQKGKRLAYNSQAAVITLDKQNKNVTVVAENKTAEELAQEAERRFCLYRDHYASQHLRVMISRILKSLAPTPVRPNGGVYFVPSAHAEG